MHIEHIDELEEFQQELDDATSTPASGQQANSRGKLLGQLLKKLAIAESPKGIGDNYGTVEGHPCRFTNAKGKDFSVYADAKVQTILFGTYKRVATAEEPLELKLVGIRFADCLKYGTTTNGKRVGVRLAALPKGKKPVLGLARIPARLTEATSLDERKAMEKLIAALTEEELDAMVVGATRRNIRNYIIAEGNLEDGQ